MSKSGILDLWPDNIHVDVLAPVAILRTQVSALSRRVGGLLRAEVRSGFGQNTIEHFLTLIAPAINDYQVTLLKTSHDAEFVYPATIQSRGLLPEKGRLPETIGVIIDPLGRDERIADTQEEFIGIVAEILRSGWVRSLIESLIARSNQVQSEKTSTTSTPAASSDK